MEAKNNFDEASMFESQEKSAGSSEVQDVDPLLLATFLKTFMKFLHNKKEVQGLQELIEKCADKIKVPSKQRNVRKLGKHKNRIGHEMRLKSSWIWVLM